ncbi:MAG: response regulator [Deltaproteobacteria bacterium]|nr:response regulator [Deltaproteobacteria bacterium]MBW1949056.1 response regulator [Deltaproteobacteria bacterium]MBW2007396.1 response regulator [Deltaproteobacteria bacterium]RLB36684.1 MAG: hypothetical protein DRH20_09270 [Deltaproteobacteria bacterium]
MVKFASQKKFSWFLTAVLLGLVGVSLSLILGSLYGFLSRTMSREYENEQKARQAEINLALRNRLNLLESRTKEVSLSNALRVNLMLGVKNQVAERAQALQPAVKGAYLFIQDRTDSKITPPLPARYRPLEPFLHNLSRRRGFQRFVFRKGQAGEPLTLFSAPILRKDERLGTVFTLYDLSRDRYFWDRFQEAWGGSLLLQTPNYLIDLKTLKRSPLPFKPRAGYGPTLELSETLYSGGTYFVPLKDFPGLVYAVGSHSLGEAKKNLLLRLSGLCAVVFMLTLAISFVIAKRMSEPLASMAEQALGISTSPTHSYLDEESIRYAEFRKLARAFNTVLKGLLDSRRKKEEAHRFLHGILNTVADPVYVMDRENRFLLINDAFCNFFHLEKDHVAGKSAADLFPEDTARVFLKRNDVLLESGQEDTSEDTIIRKAGDERLISTKKKLFQDPETGQDVLVGVMRDVTEAKRAEEELERHRDNLSALVLEKTAQLRNANLRLREEMEERVRAEKERLEIEKRLQRAKKMEALGTLAGGVAHDLNNILSGILSYPELLLMDLPGDSPLRGPLTTIHQSGKKAAAIVQDLLTLARRGVQVKEEVRLETVVSDYLRSPEFKKLLRYHPGVRVSRRSRPGLPPILGSPVHLSKALMNLVSNGAEAMPQGGEINIDLEACTLDRPVRGYDEVKPGEYVVLSVSDNGSGILPDDLDKIFEPFYTKKKMGRSGTGLGMTVVWGTVEDHGGYIDVTSIPGEGTTFHLYFPASPTRAAEAEKVFSLDRYRGRGQCILVVDDVPEQREIASAMLERLGYSVNAVASGEKALSYLESRTVDLVILDMIMEPGMDGLETLRRILKSNPEQRAIIASGFSETDRVKEARRLGARAYLKKPYSLEGIARAVWSGLGP